MCTISYLFKALDTQRQKPLQLELKALHFMKFLALGKIYDAELKLESLHSAWNTDSIFVFEAFPQHTKK